MPDPTPLTAGHIDTPELDLGWTEAPWDSILFGGPVLQINTLAVRGAGAARDAQPFVEARQCLGTPLASCRLPHDHLAESMLLEDLAYALCGFANFASIGIQIGGIGALVPNQRNNLIQLGFKSLIGGTIACFYTAAVAGMII